MLNAMGRGWTYTFVGLVWIGASPLLFAVIKWGPQWREAMRLRAEKKKAEKDARDIGDIEKQERAAV